MKEVTAKLYGHKKASTMYLALPSELVKDSTFSF
jgi:hypothetical protein